MKSRRVLAVALAVVMTVGVSPALAQQTAGLISGRATEEAKQPYSDYAVQLRDAATGQVVGTQPLSAQGQFSFSGVEMSRRYLVELFNTRENRVVCTEGPYMLSTPALPSKTDVNIDCGRTPAALWLLAAGAGAAAAIAVATRSVSQ
jgi:hypothetical protein